MNVGYNARFLSVLEPGGAAGGSFELLKHLVRIDEDNRYFIFTTEVKRDISALRRDNTELIERPPPFENRLGTVLWEQVLLPRLARRFDIDLLHNPMTSAPVLLNVPNQVATIHGLAYRHSDGYEALFTLWYDTLVRRVADRADEIITVSDYQRNDLISQLDVAPDKVHRIYNGVDSRFLDYDGTGDPPEGLPSEYVLFVGSLNPVKNISGLIRAFRRLRLSTDLPHELVIVGPEKDIFDAVDVPETDDIVRLGYIDPDELPPIYESADVLVQPSHYESFGLPPLEAMACGTPVVAADAAALPEIVGEAAILVDPDDVDDIASGIRRVLTNDSLRDRLVERGRRRAETFTWAASANATLRLYEDIVQ